MTTDSLVAALEREHQQIDHDLERFLSDPQDTAPLLQAITALRRHIYVEEEIVFPALPDPGMAVPVFVMLREHAQMWQLLASLDEQVRTEGGGAAELGRQLVVQLQHHNQKEERVVYAAAAGTIPADAIRRISDLVRSTREAPPDWVCIKARS